MGIIQKQSIKGTIYSYIGVGIGFITTAILFPRILSASEIGLLKLLVSFSMLFAQLASLGFPNVINRLFPYFRDKESGHNGFIVVALTISFGGFLLSILTLHILKPMIIRNNLEESAIFIRYFNYLIPLIFFTLFFGLFDSYIKALYDAVIGTVLKELVQRVFILIAVVFYFFDKVSFHTLVLLYVLALSLPTLILIFKIIVNGEFQFKKPGNIFNPVLWREILNLCFHGILTGFGAIAVLQLDSIMVNHYLGISLTGIYATTFFFATIILIPSRPLLKISTTIIADAWKNNDLKIISRIYKKSTNIQTWVAVLLFILLWVNIDNIFMIIPKEYESGKWVIFFIGIKNVIEMATGISSTILQTSGYYRINTFFILLFLILMVVFILILIPVAGITGTAIAIMVSYGLISLLRYIYLRVKFQLDPFNYRIFLLILAGLASFLGGYFIPVSTNYLIDIIIKCFVTGVIYVFLTVILRLSADINRILNQVFKTDYF